MIDFETFIKAYQNASPALKTFIDSEEVGNFCEKLLDKSGFEAQKKNLILLLSSYFLGSVPEQDLIDELARTGLSNDFIITNLSVIKDFLDKDISEDISMDLEIAEAEAALNSITVKSIPQTTLNSSTENTYTSTQAAILQEGRNAQNLNSSTNPGNPGRWESDR